MSTDEARADFRVNTADDVLRRHFLHIVAGASSTHGPAIAERLNGVITRAAVETGWSFTGLVIRLLEQYDTDAARPRRTIVSRNLDRGRTA